MCSIYSTASYCCLFGGLVSVVKAAQKGRQKITKGRRLVSVVKAAQKGRQKITKGRRLVSVVKAAQKGATENNERQAWGVELINSQVQNNLKPCALPVGNVA